MRLFALCFLAVLLPCFGSCENIGFGFVMALFPHGQLRWRIGAMEAKVNHNCRWCTIHTRSRACHNIRYRCAPYRALTIRIAIIAMSGFIVNLSAIFSLFPCLRCPYFICYSNMTPCFWSLWQLLAQSIQSHKKQQTHTDMAVDNKCEWCDCVMCDIDDHLPGPRSFNLGFYWSCLGLV